MVARLIGFILTIAISTAPVLAGGGIGEGKAYRDVAVGSYVFRIFQEIIDDNPPVVLSETLVVLRNGEKVFSEKGFSINVNPSSLVKIKIGADITGDSKPNVAVEMYSGGAHCCFRYLIFEVGDRLSLINDLNTGDFPAGFRKLDENPGLEIETNDGSFAYWKAPFASSPAPTIILKFKDGKYRFAAGLMRAPPMADAELKEKALAVRQSKKWDKFKEYPLDSQLWKVMLKLIYSGNADQARIFLNSAWPSGREGKEKFGKEFLECKLRQSPHWPEIAAMNNLKPLKPVGDCASGGG